MDAQDLCLRFGLEPGVLEERPYIPIFVPPRLCAKCFHGWWLETAKNSPIRAGERLASLARRFFSASSWTAVSVVAPAASPPAFPPRFPGWSRGNRRGCVACSCCRTTAAPCSASLSVPRCASASGPATRCAGQAARKPWPVSNPSSARRSLPGLDGSVRAWSGIGAGRPPGTADKNLSSS